MKMHTTNYTDTFTEVADDCKASTGHSQQDKELKTTARIEYSILKYTARDKQVRYKKLIKISLSGLDISVFFLNILSLNYVILRNYFKYN